VTAQDPLRVNIIGDFESSTGLAEAARRQVMALLAEGVQIQVVSVDLDAPKSHNRVQPAIAALPHGRDAVIDIHYENTNEFSRLPDEIVHPPGKRSYAIASWYWELPELPWDFMPSIDRVDEIWVATEYVQHIFRRITDKPVTIIPAVVEGEVSTAFDRRHFGLPDAPLLYFYNFDASSSYARKNPMGLIKAFSRAFTPEERGTRATLVVKAMRLDWLPELEKALHCGEAEMVSAALTDILNRGRLTRGPTA